MASATKTNALNPQPYGSFLLATSLSTLSAGDLDALVLEAMKVIKTKAEESGGQIKKKNDLPLATYSGLEVVGFHFIESSVCKWENSLEDKNNELLLICHQNGHTAIYCSNSDHRRAITVIIGKSSVTKDYPQLSKLQKISAGHLTSAFLENEPLKAMWLAGTHKSVQVKPDSKVISGKDLQYALDPLGDSTYLAAAARSSSAGVSLKGSGVWTKPYASMSDFAAGASSALAKIAAAKGKTAVLPILANELHSFLGVGAAFDFEVAPLEILKSSAERRRAAALMENTTFELLPSSAVAPSPGIFDLKITCKRSTAMPAPFASITVTPTFPPASPTELSFVVISPAVIGDTSLQEAINALQESPTLFRVFYETGHTISVGHLAVSSPRDRDFNGWKWVHFAKVNAGIPTPIDVSKEKPNNNDLTLIWTTPNEDSLFSWFISTISSAVTAATLDLAPLNPNGQDVWVFCDDDAGEVADFVHIHLPPAGVPEICLVHIKGARSASPGREMVAGPFEVVCGQAVKNVRYIDAGILADRIAHRIHDPARPIWNTPNTLGTVPSGDRGVFDNVLRSIGSNAKYRVLVVQPQVTDAAFKLPKNQIGASSPLLGAIQLRSLLFGAENSARAVSADFHVTGAL